MEVGDDFLPSSREFCFSSLGELVSSFKRLRHSGAVKAEL